MAILKNITLDNGISLSYHRIVRVTNITNQLSMLEIGSYTNEAKRLEEKNKIENKNPVRNIFINTEYLNLPYDENMNVVQGYYYLKSLDKFSGCSDC